MPIFRQYIRAWATCGCGSRNINQNKPDKKYRADLDYVFPFFQSIYLSQAQPYMIGMSLVMRG